MATSIGIMPPMAPIMAERGRASVCPPTEFPLVRLQCLRELAGRHGGVIVGRGEVPVALEHDVMRAHPCRHVVDEQRVVAKAVPVGSGAGTPFGDTDRL